MDQLAETFRAMGEINRLVDETLDAEHGTLREYGKALAERCDEYAATNGHEPGWVKKKAQEGILARLSREIEDGMGGYFG